MSNLRNKVKSLLRRNSKGRVVMLALSLAATLSVAMAARFYIFEPLQLHDSSMYPRHKDREILWMCKLPRCIDRIGYNETVWAKLRNGETLVRKVIALPGDKLDFSDNGRVKTARGTFKWKDETAFIQSRQLHVPRKGDTLHIAQLNDMEEDFMINLLIEQGEEFFVKTTLWQGDREIGIERVGAAKLGNRQVSLQEVDFLPWQDRYLLEQQIFHSEPGNSRIQMRREFLRKSDSTKIENVVVQEDCYFLACEKGAFCLDSREAGYFTKSHLLGRNVSEPRNAINYIKRFVAKAFSHDKANKQAGNKKEAAQPDNGAQPAKADSTKN